MSDPANNSPQEAGSPQATPAAATDVFAPQPQPAPLPRRMRGKNHFMASWLSGAASLSTTIIIAVFVITFIVQAFQIPSESMENTLLIGDYLLVDKIHYGHPGDWPRVEPFSAIRRGDIIVFRYPVNPQQHFVKRVIGLPGDHVRLVNKHVFVNGQPLREPYVVYRSKSHDPYRDDFPDPDYLNANVEARWWLQMRQLIHDGQLVVPPNEYFVLGDNRDESLDSRYWGLVPRDNIIGRPLITYFSMTRVAGLDTPPPTSFSDALSTVTYTLSQLPQRIRWQRCLRLIK